MRATVRGGLVRLRYCSIMSETILYRPPAIDFDPRVANDLARFVKARSHAAEFYAPPPLDGPFSGYTRSLTERGGFRITYWDQAGDAFLDGMRIFTGIVSTSIAGWLLARSSMPTSFGLALFSVIAAAIIFTVSRTIPVQHSVEIHPDGMIIDDWLFFSADDIGDNWPALQYTDEDNPDRMVLCGICGVQFIEFSTANRLGPNDRTPEVLAADLEMAMEQLWGRREAIVPTAYHLAD